MGKNNIETLFVVPILTMIKHKLVCTGTRFEKKKKKKKDNIPINTNYNTLSNMHTYNIVRLEIHPVYYNAGKYHLGRTWV